MNLQQHLTSLVKKENISKSNQTPPFLMENETDIWVKVMNDDRYDLQNMRLNLTGPFLFDA